MISKNLRKICTTKVNFNKGDLTKNKNVVPSAVWCCDGSVCTCRRQDQPASRVGRSLAIRHVRDPNLGDPKTRINISTFLYFPRKPHLPRNKLVAPSPLHSTCPCDWGCSCIKQPVYAVQRQMCLKKYINIVNNSIYILVVLAVCSYVARHMVHSRILPRDAIN